MFKNKFLIILLIAGFLKLYGNNPVNLGTSNSNGMYLRDIDAITYNPALLGFSDNHSFSINLLPIITFNISSDISLETYNNYFSKNSIWSAKERSEILDAIDGNTFDMNMNFKTQILAATYKNYSFQINAVAYTDFALDKEVLEIFDGLEANKTYSANNTGGGALFYTSVELGYAHEVFQYLKETNFVKENKFIKDLGIQELTLGLNFKYLMAKPNPNDTVMMKINKIDAYAVTNALGSNPLGTPQTEIGANVDLVTGGEATGYGIDFGIGIKFMENMQLGISVENLFSNIAYSNNTIHHWVLKADSLDIEDLGSFDDYEPSIEEESNEAYKDFDQELPTIFNMGYSWKLNKFSNNYLIGANLCSATGYFTEAKEVTTFSTGLEWYHDKVSWLHLRSGITFGSPSGVDIAGGFGLNFNHFDFDLGITSAGGIGESINGIAVGLGMKLYW